MLLLYAERAAHGVLALLGLYGLAGLVIAPTLAYLQEKPNFKRLNTVRCVAVMATWILISMVCSVLLLPALLVAPQWTQLAAHRLARGCSSVLLVVLSGSWECDVVGREHLPTDRPVVIAANHSSMVDVAMVYQLQCKGVWVAKSSVFLIPGVGTLGWMAGYVSFKRGNKASVGDMYQTCKRRLDEGWSLAFFPQGTRNRDTTLPFKNGAFKIAIEQKVPVLPVSIDLPDDLWWNPNAKRTLTVHPPIESAGKTVEELRKLTYAAVMSGLPGQPFAGSVLDCYEAKKSK